MRRDVQEIFRNTPHEKQVLMFSATLSKDVRPICKKFMQDVSERRHHQCHERSCRFAPSSGPPADTIINRSLPLVGLA